MSDVGHNSGAVNGAQLRSIVERIERLDEEKKGLSDDIKEIFIEAKSNGYDAKIIRMVLRERKLTKEDRQERDDLKELYMDALGEDL